MRESGISEFQPPRLDALPLAPFWLLASAFAILVVMARPWERESQARRFIVIAAIAMVPVALVASRNTPLMLLVAVPAIGGLRARRTQLQPSSGRIREERPRLNAAILAALTIVAAAAVTYAWTQPAARLGWNPLPPGVARAVESCPPRLYNRFDEGGYLIWFARGQKVFIDSRFDPYPPELVQEHIRVERTGDYARLFQRFGIRCAVVPSRSVVAQRLAGDGWAPTYDSGGWLVLSASTRRSP